MAQNPLHFKVDSFPNYHIKKEVFLIKNYPKIPIDVTHIEDYTFTNHQLTNVIIPTSVTSIGKEAFSHNQLIGLFIPDSVTSIEEGAFAHNLLSNLIIPNSLAHIGNYAFATNLLTDLMIPTGVTIIGEGAFYNNELTSVIIPDSVTSIGDGAFTRNQAKPENLTIIAHHQSPARDYATNHGHTFQATRMYTGRKTNRNVSVRKHLSVISNRSRLVRTGYTFERSQRKWLQVRSR